MAQLVPPWRDVRKLLPFLLLLCLAGLPAAALAVAPSSGVRTEADSFSATTPVRADRDRDGLFDDLAARLAGVEAGARTDVIVVLRAPATAFRVRALAGASGGLAVHRRFSIIDAFSASAGKGAIEALSRNPLVAHVEQDATAHALNDTARDSFGVTKAQLDAPGIDGNADGSASYSANDLVAAVIDTGIDAAHQDLDEGKVLAFHDLVRGLATPYDDNGHGTHVAATIAGDGDARADHLYRGVAPGAALVGVKVLDRNGSGPVSRIVAGIQWAVDNKSALGIEAINLSLGVAGCSDGSSSDSLAVNAAAAAGLVPAVAAGNEGPGTCTIGSPGAATGALTVGAMADMGANGFDQAYFSSRGKTADGRIKPDVSGPGVDITSAQAGTTTGYVSESGTSMATPFVCGLSLLMRDVAPALTPAQVKSKIGATAIDWARGGDNKAVGSTGPDIDYGSGRLDGYAALESAGAPIDAPPGVPDHLLREGTLSGTGAQVDFPIVVRDKRFPIAATLIIPSLSAGAASTPDFDLYLLDPSGTQVAASEFQTRQEEFGFNPTRVGTYILRVRSFAGSGGFFVDVSAGLRAPFDLPAAASPLSVSLVPAFRQTISSSQCLATGRTSATHGPPLALASCDPPAYVPGTAAHLGPSSASAATLTVVPGNLATAADEADLSIAVNAPDVRNGAGGDYDPSAVADVTLKVKLRLSDTYNGGALEDPATVGDFELSVPASCVVSPGPQGSTCSASTGADAVTPGSIREGTSMVVQAFRVRMDDAGANAVRGDGDDHVFAQQGLFVR
jgi:serine protease AprX